MVTEDLDRLSRDQEDIAGIYKRMEFAGVKIVTSSDGIVTDLHIGLKGTMDARFLKDLAPGPSGEGRGPSSCAATTTLPCPATRPSS